MRPSPASPRVRFPRDDGFHAALKRGVGAYFEATGRAKTGGAAMRAKTGVILAWFAASYGLLLAFGGASAWLVAALTASIALATAGIEAVRIGIRIRNRIRNRIIGRSNVGSTPTRGSDPFHGARTHDRYEVVHMIRKGQVRWSPKGTCWA